MKIHYLRMKNGAMICMTQIAGFLPRMITSSDKLTEYKAGDYFGMIKLGSRVDLLIPKYAPDGSIFVLNINTGQSVNIADSLGYF
jgi:phosphatidylserine decarboxylase